MRFVANATETAHRDFFETTVECGSCPEDEETAILSIGREFLPEHARVVLDGGAPSAEYYHWLRGQTEKAQAEHDREIAAGHEWHG